MTYIVSGGALNSTNSTVYITVTAAMLEVYGVAAV